MSYDIKQWTSSKEKKVFQYKKTMNGTTLSIEDNLHFIENDLNIPLSSYTNPFFPDNNFDFFINNSGVNLLYKSLQNKTFTTKIDRTGSFIEYGIPSIVDIKNSDLPALLNGNISDNISLLHKYNFLLKKYVEGLVIY